MPFVASHKGVFRYLSLDMEGRGDFLENAGILKRLDGGPQHQPLLGRWAEKN